MSRGNVRAFPLTLDKAERKRQPIGTGVVDYFPNAFAAVSEVSFEGNEQHNPGEELHWARGKSTDHSDALQRHFIERYDVDDDGMLHAAKMAWRALAFLQELLEERREGELRMEQQQYDLNTRAPFPSPADPRDQ